MLIHVPDDVYAFDVVSCCLSLALFSANALIALWNYRSTVVHCGCACVLLPCSRYMFHVRHLVTALCL